MFMQTSSILKKEKKNKDFLYIYLIFMWFMVELLELCVQIHELLRHAVNASV